MRIQYLQHVPFEGPAALERLLRAQGHGLSGTPLYAGAPLPTPPDYDGLLVMGGPMGVYDGARHRWLDAEVELIAATLAAGKPVLGICLGAQLMARALDAEVSCGHPREIGWYPVERDPALAGSWLESLLPQRFDALHWHGDRFAIPAGCVPLGHSAACPTQGFLYRQHGLALQFHLEATPESLAALIEHCGGELDGSDWVQQPAEMLSDRSRFSAASDLLAGIVGRLFAA